MVLSVLAISIAATKIKVTLIVRHFVWAHLKS